MAEKAANIRANLDVKPSIFEVLAINSLSDSIYPAFRQVAFALASSNPQRFGWLSKYVEETFIIFNSLLEFYYLKVKSATFAECFYGLQRIPASSSSKLTINHKLASLIYIITVPYLKRKLEEKIEVYRIQHSDGTLDSSITGFCKKSILNFYSLSRIVYTTLTLFQYLRYISGKSEHQTIPLRLLNLKLVNPSEIEPQGFWISLLQNELTWSEIVHQLLPNLIRGSFETTAFFIQFLNAWNSNQSNHDPTILPTVPPPKMESNSMNYRGKCPICFQTWKIPTCLPVSGYVFCFTCIYKHLLQNKFCPVTHLPVQNMENIIRMYE